jgi:hypothetical protein
LDETPSDDPRSYPQTAALPILQQDGSLDGRGGMTIRKTQAETTAPTPLSAKIRDGPQSAAAIHRQPAQDADLNPDPSLVLYPLEIPGSRRDHRERQTAS